MNMEGHTALVTGGAVRIGAAICRTLAGRGCTVVIHCNRSLEQAGLLAAELLKTGARAAVVSHALDEGHPEELIDKAWKSVGPVDMLINNASVFHKQPLRDTSAAELRRQFEVNLLAPMLLTRRFSERLLEKRGREGDCGPANRILGRVANLLDRRVAHNEAGCIPYLISKKGLADFTRAVALELAPCFTVNGVAPGAILPPPGKGEAYLSEAAGPVPLNVRCRPEDVAEAVVWLLGNDTVTGQVVYVDGGQHLL